MKNKKIWAFLGIFLILIIILLSSQFQRKQSNQVLFKTNKGDILIQLYEDVPITTENFKKLIKQGFYNNTTFHRVIQGFMIQGGDPNGDGSGGPGYVIKDEFTHKPSNKNNRGTISMANAGPNTGGSQFFINLVNNNYLDSKHPVFGEIISGMDIIGEISKVPTDSNDRPLESIIILEAKILN